MMILQITGGVVLLLGTLICMIGGIGLLRLPNFFARTHGGSITDTLGAGLALLGMMIFTCGMEDLTHLEQFLVIAKLISIAIFILVTSPISGHALTRSAYEAGLAGDGSPLTLKDVEGLPMGIYGPASLLENKSELSVEKNSTEGNKS
jgi:multicomponent Na+:H+ antiporter subunit G